MAAKPNEHVLLHPSTLGPVLAAARKRADLSQRALAERIGVTQGRISQVERGKRISLDLALQFAREVGLELVARPIRDAATEAAW